MEKTRLNKYLAECGICSRREADSLIEKGKVMVNGRRAETGMKVDSRDNIAVNGMKVTGPDKKVVLAFYKPVGITCSENDSHADKIITDVIDYPIRVTYAGRLDRDSEGLIILTNDGELINRLMKGKNGHEKEYLVRVTTPLPRDFKENMEGGIYLKELRVRTKPCRVEIVDDFTFRIILTQGLNRQIRRMCSYFGLKIDGLMRVRIANIRLGRLQPGTYRRLGKEELTELYDIVGINKKEL